MCATCPLHLILLDLITLIIFSTSTNYKVPHLAVIFSLLLHPPTWVQMFFSPPLTPTDLFYVLPLYKVTQLSSRTAYILRKPHLKSNISFNILQNNLLQKSYTFVLAHKIVGNTF
jgi:hypothetical protein